VARHDSRRKSGPRLDAVHHRAEEQADGRARLGMPAQDRLELGVRTGFMVMMAGRADSQLAAVGGDDRVDEREPEAGAAAGA
jgi:hypothetical protein